MNIPFVRSLLLYVCFSIGLRAESKIPKLFTYDPNFADFEIEKNAAVYKLETIYVTAEKLPLPIAFERDMDRIFKGSVKVSQNSFTEKLSIASEDELNLPRVDYIGHVSQFKTSSDVLKFRDGFEIGLPGGQKMRMYFKSGLSIKLGEGRIILRPSRRRLISYKLQW